MNRRIRLMLVLALIALSMAIVSCKPIDYYLGMVYKAYGTVTEKTGNDIPGVPLSSVEVIVSGYQKSYQYSDLTNVDGKWELELAEGTWTLAFVKEGYETISVGDIKVNANNPRYDVGVVELVPITPEPGDIVGVWFGEKLDFVNDPAVVDMQQTYTADGYFEFLYTNPENPEEYYEASQKGIYTTAEGMLETQITHFLSDYDPDTGVITWVDAPAGYGGASPYEIVGDTLTEWINLSGWGGSADTVWTLKRQP
jgi:hypothetical protein